jgi:hypothetical protein
MLFGSPCGTPTNRRALASGCIAIDVNTECSRKTLRIAESEWPANHSSFTLALSASARACMSSNLHTEKHTRARARALTPTVTQRHALVHTIYTPRPRASKPCLMSATISSNSAASCASLAASDLFRHWSRSSSSTNSCATNKHRKIARRVRGLLEYSGFATA